MSRWLFRGAVITAAMMCAAVLLLSQNGSENAPITLATVPQDDVILRAMRDEMERSQQLRVAGAGEVPYYFSFSVTDAENLTISASLGAVYNASRNRFRAPSLEVRVGTYEFDHTGHIFSGIYTGSRYDGGWPLDDNYSNLRQALWLGTDIAYKAALESMSRKRASLNSAAKQTESLPDFSRSPAVVRIAKVNPVKVDQPALMARAAKISGVFNGYPEALTSALEIHILSDTTYLLNSEGTALRYADNLGWIFGKAEGQAPDGMLVHDAITFQANDPANLPAEPELQRAFAGVGENIRALIKAPAGEAYSGPVLFEPQAAAQLLAQLVGENLRVARRPVAEPGRSVNYQPSDFESKMGSRILPDSFDITDDSTQATWNGKPLAGAYEFDLEGVPPKPVAVVEKGVLKSFLTTRQPIRGFTASNGHARLSGSYGARSAAIGSMFVKSNETTPLAALKQRLIAMLGERNKPYGMLVRKLDYPFAGSAAELQALNAAAQQSGVGRMFSPPILLYRVYPDGREELVRGLRFRGVSTRSLRDIVGTSAETALFEWVNNTAPLSMLGAGGYLAGTSVVAPALLFDEMEFEPPREQLPRAPIVAPPPK